MLWFISALVSEAIEMPSSNTAPLAAGIFRAKGLQQRSLAGTIRTDNRRDGTLD